MVSSAAASALCRVLSEGVLAVGSLVLQDLEFEGAF